MCITVTVIQRNLIKICNLGELYLLGRNLKLQAKKEERAIAVMEENKAPQLDLKMKSKNKENLEMSLILIKTSALRILEQLSLHQYSLAKGKILGYISQKNLTSIKIGLTFKHRLIRTTINVLLRIIRLWEKMDCSLKILKIWFPLIIDFGLLKDLKNIGTSQSKTHTMIW